LPPPSRLAARAIPAAPPTGAALRVLRPALLPRLRSASARFASPLPPASALPDASRTRRATASAPPLS